MSRYRYRYFCREMIDMRKFKCSVCGNEKAVESQENDVFHNPVCCGKKMYVAS